MARTNLSSNDFLIKVLSPIAISRPFSMACRVQLNTLGVLRSFLSLSVGGGSAIQYCFKVQLNNRFGIQDNTTTINEPSGARNTGSWYSLVGVYASATDRRFYVDGVEVASTGSNIPFTQPAIFTLGGESRSGIVQNPFVSGSIADVALWNTDLSVDDVISYAKGMSGDKIRTANLITNAKLIRDIDDPKNLGFATSGSVGIFAGNHPAVYN